MSEPAYLRHLPISKCKDKEKMAIRRMKAKRAKDELVRLIENEGYLEHGTKEIIPDSDFFGTYWWPAVREGVLTRDGYKCTMCGCTDKQLHVHHICPRHTGGSDNPLNLRTLCVDCHKAIHAHDHIEKASYDKNQKRLI